MSEEAAVAGRNEVWIEKYRPATLGEVVGQEDVTNRLAGYVEQRDLPHLLFSGPAGVGKCVTGETPVLTSRGIERIDDIVGEVEGFAEPDDELAVLTFDGSEFRFVEPSHLFCKRTDVLISIRSRDGSTLTVTPEHKLLVIGQDGLSWKPADELVAGDRVVRPRSLPLPGTGGYIDWMSEMDGERTLVHVTEEFASEYQIPAEEGHIGGMKDVIRGVRDGRNDIEIAEAAGLKKRTVQEYRRRVASVDLDASSPICSLGFLRELDVSQARLKRHVTAIQYVSPQNKRSEPISPPWSVTPELATFVGLAISEACLSRTMIKFYNTDERLLDQFSSIARDVFEVEPTDGEQRGVPYRVIHNRTLSYLLESCFGVFSGAATGTGIGSAIVSADAGSRAAFLRAVFDAEGHVSDGGIIELTQKNGDHITLISYLLAGFGIPSRRKVERKAASNGSGEKREYHVLSVSGAPSLARFRDVIGFVIEEKADRLARFAAKDSNPNHDTIPVQSAVDDLCEALYLPKDEILTQSLDPNNPGRQNYLSDIDRVLSAANDRLEVAQTVLDQLTRLEAEIGAVSGVPASWVSNRATLGSIDVRRGVAGETGIRSDRLLEYADGRRTPAARRGGNLLVDLGGIDERPQTSRIQDELRTAIRSLGVPYSHVADGTSLRGTDIINLLTHDDHDLRSLTRFATVTQRVREEAAKMLNETVLEAVVTLETVSSADLYFDRVEEIERVNEEQRVYDLTVPGTRNYVAGAVPTVVHNTTAATAIAHELYGDDWEANFLELNASDERGIDVVRERIKNFARSSFGGYDYRIIFLDEADALTGDAQSALRRTMEQFSNNTRFILSVNYSSKVIDPIQSRCAVFRFSPIPDEAVAERIREIAEDEGIELADDGVDALTYAADGDMRKAINALQAAAVLGETVDEEAVFTITSTARPEDIREMVEAALEGDFTGARSVLDDLLTEQGLAGGDVIDQLHRSVWDFDLDDEAAVRLLDRVGEADYRIAEGANERLQLEALLAAVALQGRD